LGSRRWIWKGARGVSAAWAAYAGVRLARLSATALLRVPDVVVPVPFFASLGLAGFFCVFTRGLLPFGYVRFGTVTLMPEVTKIALTTRVASPVIFVALSRPARLLGIGAERARAQSSRRCITVLRPLRGDHARWAYPAL